MAHRLSASSRVGAALVAAGLIATLGAGSVVAGEITGNGRLLTMHGRSECSFSGQEDLQFYTDDSDTTPRSDPTKGDPKHAQSWGQISKADRDFLTSIGLNPGIACNPTRASGGE